MIYEISGICQNCRGAVEVVVEHNRGKIICQSCKQEPFKVRPFNGVIYVCSVPSQKGLVKVGKTTKTAETRAKGLSTSGVAGKFKVLAVFPSRRLNSDEKKAHDKLQRYHHFKEHFKIDPAEAIAKIRSALNRREPIIYDSELKAQVSDIVEKNRRTMTNRIGNGHSRFSSEGRRPASYSNSH